MPASKTAPLLSEALRKSIKNVFLAWMKKNRVKADQTNESADLLDKLDIHILSSLFIHAVEMKELEVAEYIYQLTQGKACHSIMNLLYSALEKRHCNVFSWLWTKETPSEKEVNGLLFRAAQFDSFDIFHFLWEKQSNVIILANKIKIAKFALHSQTSNNRLISVLQKTILHTIFPNNHPLSILSVALEAKKNETIRQMLSQPNYEFLFKKMQITYESTGLPFALVKIIMENTNSYSENMLLPLLIDNVPITYVPAFDLCGSLKEMKITTSQEENRKNARGSSCQRYRPCLIL